MRGGARRGASKGLYSNVRAAKPLFQGHAQPKEPGELGYYDLLSPDTRQAQAELARSHGIEGFCYWHYWFAGKRLLNRPFDEVLRRGEPNYPFCLAWANHSWNASWVGRPYELFIDQTYPGIEDYEAHWRFLAEAFADERYVTVDGKPVFVIFRPKGVPNLRKVADQLREWAERDGFPGLHLLGIMNRLIDPRVFGLDGSIDPGVGRLVSHLPRAVWTRSEAQRRVKMLIERPEFSSLHQAIAHLRRPRILSDEFDHITQQLLLPLVHPYSDAIDRAMDEDQLLRDRYPTAVPNWDNTPRRGRWGIVFDGSTPEKFAEHLKHAVDLVSERPAQERLVFIKSWNEWAEGNYLEPDARFGRTYLEAAKRVLAPKAPTAIAAEMR